MKSRRMVEAMSGVLESVQYYGTTPLSITFQGQQIPQYVLGSTSTYTIYGADISAFAGQTGELRFSGGGFLDNVQ